LPPPPFCFPPWSRPPPRSPNNLPPNTVFGRLGIGSGPGQAIPFAILTNNLLSNMAGVTVAADSANLFVGFKKSGVRAWNWTYDTQNFGSGSSVNSLKLCSDLACSVPMWITDYGFLNLGNIKTSFPGLSTISDTTGPALRIVGDIAIGDVRYWGAATSAGVQVQQIGARMVGAYPSNTVFSAGEPGATNDGTGSGQILIHPDSTCTNCVPSGTVEIHAHGSGADSNSNEIRFYTRSGTNADALIASMGGPTAGTGGFNLTVGSYQGVNGTNLLPTYAFGSDATTGIYLSAGAQLGFTNGGTQRMALDGNGLVLSVQLQYARVAFAGLGTCNTAAQGKTWMITDSNTGTFNATITAGAGANIGLAVCNGSNWTFH
jgi:hypothetical protein